MNFICVMFVCNWESEVFVIPFPAAAASPCVYIYIIRSLHLLSISVLFEDCSVLLLGIMCSSSLLMARFLTSEG